MPTTATNHHYVITGGPGAGKTSIIEGLRARGFRCVDEVGRKIIQQQLRIGGNAVHGADRETYLELMLSWSMRDYDQVGEAAQPVFFDRGIPGLIGYCRLSRLPVPDHVRNAVKLFRYNRKVFVTPPWKEIYRNDAERKQDFAEAVETYDTLVAAYKESGYEPVAVPCVSVDERVDFILNAISAR